MKYINRFILTFLISLTFTLPLEIKSQSELEQQIEAGLFDYEPEMSDMINTALDPNITRATKASTIDTLTDADEKINAHLLLQNPIYFRSHPIGRRSIIDLAIFQNFATFIPLTKLSCLPFYTQTYQEYYFKEYEAIKHYIDMKQDHLIRALDVLRFTTFNVPQVLSLFENLKLQERQIGFMFEGVQTTDEWSFSARMPLYYTEHNMFLTSSEQATIEDSAIFVNFEGDPIQFAKDHLISDYIGLGDTKINFEYLLKTTPKYQFSLGGKITVPTTWRIGKGIIGSHFDVNKKAFDLDLHSDILDLIATPDKIKDNVAAFGLDVMDRLSTILLEQGAGNNHHFGFGIFGHSTMFFREHVYLTSLSSMEVFTPAPEKRFFIVKNDEGAFNAFNWDNVNVQVEDKLTFLNAQLKEKFFPPAYSTVIWPGVIFQSTMALTYEGQKWNFVAGSDFWWKTKEHFLNIKAPSDIKDLLEIEKAKRGHLYQTGVWVAAERHPFPESEWQFGVRLGTTTLSNGIGQDVSFAFHVENFF
jgi:hypothetical protein